MTLSLPHSRTLIVTTKRGTKNAIQVRHKKPIYHKHPEPKTEEEKNLTELNNLFKPKARFDETPTTQNLDEYELSKALEESLNQFQKRTRHRTKSKHHEPEWE